MKRGLFAPIIVALLLALVCQANAAPIPASAWADEEQSSVRLIAAADALGEDGSVRLGLEFRLKPGWKVYWRSPGDAGFPPQLDFSGSENAEPGPLAWPVPERFSVLGLETLGYQNAVVLPFTLSAPDPTNPSRLSAKLRYLTCKEICIPYDAELRLTLPPGKAAPSPLAHTIGQFDSRVPRTPEAARLDVEKLWSETSEKGLYLTADVTSELPLKAPDIYVEGPTGLAYGAPMRELSDGRHRATLRVPVSGYRSTPAEAGEQLTGTSFTLTLRDGKRAAETALDAGPPAAFAPGTLSVPPAHMATESIVLILLFAFLGGLILNLMPCVLPVLSIKLLSLVKHGGGDTARVRFNFLMSAAGVVTAFMILAAALAGLKTVGAGVGWGIQFQQPWFLIAMSILVTLFACNLWGFFEIRLPGAVNEALATGGSAHAGAFVQGMFATLLATPCSAPFLGTAVGFALARGPFEIGLIFFVLGLGLAAPYLLVAAIPRIATAMPRPGAWMNKLRFALGLALAGTALWLLSVIAGVAGMSDAIFTGVVLVGIAIWLGPVMRIAPEIRKATPVVLLFATLATVSSTYIGGVNAPLDPEKPALSKIAWKPFDRATLESLVAAGHLVFVDVTADWCITCQVNKRLVLERGRILEFLNGPDVVAMQADWTRPEPEITEYLASFGRYGIPFNAVYGPQAPNGVPLPELLTGDNVLGGFRKAAPANLAKRFGR